MQGINPIPYSCFKIGLNGWVDGLILEIDENKSPAFSQQGLNAGLNYWLNSRTLLVVFETILKVLELYYDWTHIFHRYLYP